MGQPPPNRLPVSQKPVYNQELLHGSISSSLSSAKEVFYEDVVCLHAHLPPLDKISPVSHPSYWQYPVKLCFIARNNPSNSGSNEHNGISPCTEKSEGAHVLAGSQCLPKAPKMQAPSSFPRHTSQPGCGPHVCTPWLWAIVAAPGVLSTSMGMRKKGTASGTPAHCY